MALSGAATSSSLGIFADSGSWIVQLGQVFIALCGLETGRYVQFRTLNYWDKIGGHLHIILLGGLGLTQAWFFRFSCDGVDIKAAEPGFAGGYECLEHPLIWTLCGGILALAFVLIMGAMLSQLKLSGFGVYRYLALQGMIGKIFRATQHVEIVAHSEPDQVFLADGGHFENTAIIPLLRRKVDRIIAVDAEDSRDLRPLKDMMQVALDELGVTFRLPEPPPDPLFKGRQSVPFERGLQDFLLPRCVIDPFKLSANMEGRSRESRREIIDKFCADAYDELSPVMARLRHAVHIHKSVATPDIVYVYFKSEAVKRKAVRTLLEHPSYGQMNTLPLRLNSESLLDAPMCNLWELKRRISWAVVEESASKWQLSADQISSATLAKSKFREILCQKMGFNPKLTGMLSPQSGADHKGVYLIFANEEAAQEAGCHLYAQGVESTISVLVTPPAIDPDTEHLYKQDEDDEFSEGAKWVQQGLCPDAFGHHSKRFMRDLSALTRRLDEVGTKIQSVRIARVRIGCLSARSEEDKALNKRLVPVAKITIQATPAHRTGTSCGKVQPTGIFKDIMECGLCWRSGLALGDSYREALHLKVQYNDGYSGEADLHIVKGEVSTMEAAAIDRSSTPERSCLDGLPRPLGEFPNHVVSSEAYPQDLFSSYCAFKRRAARSMGTEPKVQANRMILLRRIEFGESLVEPRKLVVCQCWVDFVVLSLRGLRNELGLLGLRDSTELRDSMSMKSDEDDMSTAAGGLDALHENELVGSEELEALGGAHVGSNESWFQQERNEIEARTYLARVLRGKQPAQAAQLGSAEEQSWFKANRHNDHDDVVVQMDETPLSEQQQAMVDHVTSMGFRQDAVSVVCMKMRPQTVEQLLEAVAEHDIELVEETVQ
eukprot:TRINITY_DN6471_c0_g1_i1.p2 TRINITY_DN6471_c0_g1~~TRINITY_DN6471_c0_g1_i1.p2  ORF type:complete len:887 (+),score=169.76 TRINITY_DN6471_c0_g1_i1:3194-5854(+)